LRGSGAIEQDADLVLLLYRKSYYAQQKQSAAGQAEVIVSKNRNGPTGTITLGVDLATYRFWGHGTSKPPYLVQAPLIQRPSTGAASL